jgi:23S rRNA (cytidine2498-2'-O)-methyltransferase
MSDQPGFLFVTCQVGAEAALKGEVARRWPEFRFAYSRPGFVTFKLPKDHSLPADFDLEAVFARAHAFSLGKVTGDDPEKLAAGVWGLWGNRPVKRLHVWQRDREPPGEHDFEPSITQAAVEAAEAIRRGGVESGESRVESKTPHSQLSTLDSRPPRRGEMVLDCVLVEPQEWWVGFHQVHSAPSQWPGGMMPLEMPPEAVSRAWLKMEEALRWSELPIPRGARCAELGSAPGGASQALLARGYDVLGIDPAEMHPAVVENPHFTHIRRRAGQVRRRDFRKVRWLMADMNVAPGFTLDAVESIVTHPEVNVRGMLLTLKLFEWKLAEELPAWLERIRSWGYNMVRARQLQHDRQEVCVAALQKPFVRKA